MKIKISQMATFLALLLASCQPLASIATPGATSATPETASAPAEEYSGAVYQIPTVNTRICATVTADRALHLRATPDETGEHLAYMLTGDQLTVLALGSWWKVQTTTGKIGYANARYLQEVKCPL